MKHKGILYSTLLALVSSIISQNRDGRLFSNLFGISGHKECESNLPGFSKGTCYNEVECIMKRGKYKGYCDPPTLTGVCCVFATNKCGAIIEERVSYFTNPSYPFEDSKPNSCMAKVKPLQDTCWIQVDLEEFELATNNDGTCDIDSMVILNSAGGSGGKICGKKNSFSYVAKAPKQGDAMGISFVVQSPSYKWNIKITQIKCNQIQRLPYTKNCGQSPMLSDNQESIFTKSSQFGKSGKFRRKRRLNINAKSLCKSPSSNYICQYFYSMENKRSLNKLTVPNPITKKKLFSELFRPSFSSRNTFCSSKFRQSRQNKPSFKIIDGFEADRNSFPWIASLQYKNEHFCAGSLINENFIITAAHCIELGNIRDFFDNFKIYFGVHDLTSKSENQIQVRGAKKIFNYWRFNNKAGKTGDFAMIQLDSPVEFTNATFPICLPTNSKNNFQDKTGIVAGWGVTESGASSDLLRHVEQKIISNHTCVENMQTINVNVADDMICTFKGPDGTESICSGDSGGPLMIDSNGRFNLIGVISFSVSECSAPFPAIYSRVSFYLNWISAVISMGN